MTALPAWGRLLRERREAAGLTIRQAAGRAGMSDSFWGQVEKGWHARGGMQREFVPSIGTLLHCARGLQLDDADTDRLIEAAGYDPLPARPTAPTKAGPFFDTSGLTTEDLRALEHLASRLRGPVKRNRGR